MTTDIDENTQRGGGAVLSNNDTIHALRQGVDVFYRVDEVTVTDAFEQGHTFPIALVEEEGSVTVSLLRDALDEADRRASGPRRRAGTVEVGSLESLIEYVNRYKVCDSVAFAPLNPPSVTVVFDFHEKTNPDDSSAAAGWCGDRATYKCPLSRQWQLWTAAEGKPFTQVQFGELIDQNETDLRGDDEAGLASAARMLEVARHLVVNSTGKFERKVNLTTGEGTLVASDEHASSSTKIPKAFGLAIPVFEGSDTHYLVECQVRFSMVEGRPQFAFVMKNRPAVFDKATAELRAAVAERCAIPVFVGVPPAAK